MHESSEMTRSKHWRRCLAGMALVAVIAAIGAVVRWHTSPVSSVLRAGGRIDVESRAPQWVLRLISPTIHGVSFRDTSVTDQTISCLNRLTGVEAIDLSSTGLTDAGIARLKTSASVRQLSLPGGVHGSGLQAVPRLFPNLEKLRLEPAYAQDAAVANTVSQLPGLRDLRIARFTSFGANTASAIGALDALEVVVLAHASGVTDAHMQQVAHSTTVRLLDLEGTDIDDTGVAALGTMPALEFVNVGYTKVTDSSLKTFASMQSVKVVYVGGTHVSNDAIADTLATRPDMIFVDGQLKGWHAPTYADEARQARTEWVRLMKWEN